MHICLTIDQNYVDLAKICIYSIATCKHPDTEITFHILGNKVDNLDVLKQFETKSNITIEVKNILDLERKIPVKIASYPHLTNTCWIRYFLPELYPDLNRILYLDADIIAKKDLTDLYKTDLNNKAIGAVKDFGINYFGNPPSDYSVYTSINTGVMLMDLDQLRAMDYTKICIERTCKNPDNDQVIMNQFMGNNIWFLPPIYNYSYHYTLLYGKVYTDINIWNKTYGTKYTSMKDLTDQSVLWHFHGNKMKQRKNTTLNKIWSDYESATNQFLFS